MRPASERSSGSSESAPSSIISQSAACAGHERQQVHGFGDHGPDCDEGIADGFQRHDRPTVGPVVAVKAGDERASVNENGAHGR